MSAKVALQKFSFPFASSVSLSSQDKVTQGGCVLVKDTEFLKLKENPILGEQNHITVVQALVENEDQALESTNPPDGGDTVAAQCFVRAQVSQIDVVARQSIAENLRVEVEDQRPAAKRQLSSESAAKSITAVKKSALRKEPNELRHLNQKAQLGQRGELNAALPGQRKCSKDLFKSSEVFHRLDSHVIRTGAELKQKCVYDVKTIVQSITQGARNELEQLRAIWVWLCNNIEYDVGGFLGHSEKLSSSEEVIAAGRGVCCSYSNLCTEMCREVGIECQEVTGHSKGIGYRQGQSLKHIKSDHLWNAVLLGGEWFLLDACWGAGQVDMQHESFVKRFDDFYFLTDPEEFIDSHFPDEEKWQLLDKPISIEEFEQRVFKTSAFFTMGLRLISPLHHIITDDGEATVSLGFSRPTTFTYEITRHQDLLHCGALERKDSTTSSFGLLTVSHRSMKLQLLPPESDTYDVKLFARFENATTPLVWVCSFTVECPNPRATEDIPENPFLSWGLQPFAGSLGVVGSSQNSEIAEVEDGVFDLVLKTSRPLIVLCELVHPQMESDIARCCLATQIQPDSLTCHILCPFHGFYRLSLFVRDFEKTDVKFQNAVNYLLHCKGKVVGLEELFPPDLGSACGPGTRTAKAGLSRFSHNSAMISTQQGKCNITFYNQQDFELHYVLSKKCKNSTFPLSRYIFCTYTDRKVTVSLSLPEAGVYRLGIYARITSGGDFSLMCDFILRNNSPQTRPPFPCVYSAWGKGCVLFEPRVGLLEPLSWVLFRVRVPGALRVSVVVEGRTDLKLNKSRVWEGEVFSGSSLQQLKLTASFGETSEMSVLMIFDVKQLENEGAHKD
ncbi:kyphoscoliosis peptidase [Girardinichthys multiradiatus]|uniref:kyphoscoliosis peptidase n=1 Tax=Girardinichthys multiradiatus TaxID=208333 RepID=UPI001FACB443|nr:kyphoscoliosis peptidase [Girardinichthys multiradiatus]